MVDKQNCEQDCSLKQNVQDIMQDVDTTIKEAQSSGDIRKQVVAKLAEAQIQKRVDKLTQAMEQYTQLQKELDKIKPDIQSFDENGGILQDHYSKEQLKKKQQKQKELNKLDSQISKAIMQADYNGLKE